MSFTRYRVKSDKQLFSAHCFTVLLLALGLIFGIAPTSVVAKPFKVTNVHFETNASACDMGPQIGFDADGITDGAIQDPNGHKIYGFQSAGGMKVTGGQAEGFLEGIEPQITELVAALGCPPSTEEGVSTLAELFTAWP